jgi:hypothetical protein
MKLEDLPKRADFKVPDGYFEGLPTRIQSRINAGKARRWEFSPRFALRYALPLVALVAIGVVWYQQSNNSIMEKLEQFDEAQLTYFIEDPDLTSEELAEVYVWSSADLEALEEEVYTALDASGNELDIVIEELDLENF